MGINQSELLHLMQQSSVVIVDLRKKEDFAKGHIKGSVLAQFNEETLLDVPTNSILILVSNDEEQSKNMAISLNTNSIEAKYLKGGLTNWTHGLYCTNISYVGTDYP